MRILADSAFSSLSRTSGFSVRSTSLEICQLYMNSSTVRVWLNLTAFMSASHLLHQSVLGLVIDGTGDRNAAGRLERFKCVLGGRAHLSVDRSLVIAERVQAALHAGDLVDRIQASQRQLEFAAVGRFY